ncbi:MAG: DUF11 domain-containing protein [Chloroflexi bacterium]|nr:DUF11 domain-containing protein [Chloroflexota bacterium]
MGKRAILLMVAMLVIGLFGAASVLASPSLQAPTDADVRVTKADAPDPVLVGQDLTYTVTVTNNGPAAATGVTLTDTLPANATFISVTFSQGGCTLGVGTVTCNLANLANGASAIVTIRVRPTVAGVLTNTASVAATQQDPNAANNTVSQTTTVTAEVVNADLEVTKADAPDPVLVGQGLTYTVTVTNKGPAAATGVTLTDTLPGNVTFGSLTFSQGSCALSGSTVTCNLGNLANGASALVTITVTPGAAGALSNTVSVTGAQADPDAADNTVTTTTTVNAMAAAPVAEIEFEGTVQALPAQGVIGTWTIQGLTVQVSQGAGLEIEGTPQVGDFVEVEGAVSPDGIVHAREIKGQGFKVEDDEDEDNRGRGRGHGRGGADDDDDRDNRGRGRGHGRGHGRGGDEG